MLWRGATSAWLHVGCDAVASHVAIAAAVEALLRMLYAVDAAMLFLAWRLQTIAFSAANAAIGSVIRQRDLLAACYAYAKSLLDCDLQVAKVLDCLRLSKTWTHCQDAYEASIHSDPFLAAC